MKTLSRIGKIIIDYSYICLGELVDHAYSGMTIPHFYRSMTQLTTRLRDAVKRGDHKEYDIISKQIDSILNTNKNYLKQLRTQCTEKPKNSRKLKEVEELIRDNNGLIEDFVSGTFDTGRIFE